MKTVVYAVFKLLTEVDVKDVSGLTHKVNITGLEGYIPVFKTIEEAKEVACDGKYQIVVMSI